VVGEPKETEGGVLSETFIAIQRFLFTTSMSRVVTRVMLKETYISPIVGLRSVLSKRK